MNAKLFPILRPIVVFLLKVLYRIEIVNKENIPKDGPMVFVGNHKHNYDFISLISATKRTVHFLAKKELIDKHGWLFNRLGIIPVDRSSKNKEAIKMAIDMLNKGEIIGIFPEGTFNKTEYIIKPFKYGAVKIASEAKCPIVPFAIVGEYKLLKKGLKIIFGKPFFVKDKQDLTKENIKLMNEVIRLLKKEKK